MKYLFMICCWLLGLGAQAQNTTIKGKLVNNEKKEAVAGVNVMVQLKNRSGVLQYALTDNNGAYQLSFNTSADSVTVSIAGFHIKKQSQTVVNRSQDLNFTVALQSITIKEVKVTPPKIRKLGDTIDISVGAYADKNDRVIADVLRKMPGIEVKSSGQIQYNNRPINKLYIENKDMLQGRYGIATNNISAKDVESVQVLENHQAIKALQDKEFSEDAAINLKLKETAKGTLTANAQLGAGLSTDAKTFLWNNELFSMFFNKNRQNMNSYKGNNTGNDVARDFASFYGGNAMTEGNMLSVQSPGTPGIGQKRYLFNRANAITVNNLWSLGKDYQLRANLDYLNDRQDRSSYSHSVYYLPGDSLLTIEEKLSSRSHLNHANADISLEANTKQYFLTNSLKFNGKWNSDEGNVLNSQTIHQDLDKPSYKISNDFRLIKNYEKTNLTFSSFNGYTSTPQVLTVQPVLYDSLFDPDGQWSAMRQKVLRNSFSSNNSLSFGFTHGKWSQDYRVGFSADIQSINSALQPKNLDGSLVPTADSLHNDLHWNKYQAFASPNYNYNNGKFRASLGLPLSYNWIHVNNKTLEQEKNTRRFYLNPNFFFSYKINAFWDMSARASYTNGMGGIDREYTGYIMRSYRNLNRNEGTLLETKNQTYSLNIGYRHPIKALFGSASISYFSNWSNLLYGHDYRGILSVQTTIDMPNTTTGYNVNARISKGIDVLSSTLSISGNYTSADATQLSQGELLKNKSSGYSLEPSLSIKIRSWASFMYTFTFAESKNKVENDVSNFAPIRSTSQKLELNLFPLKNLVLNLGYEYYYNSAIASGSRSMSFGDVGVKYTWKKIQFNLDYSNIFNSKQYISASYSSTNTFYYAYDLRPAEILLKVRFKLK